MNSPNGAVSDRAPETPSTSEAQALTQEAAAAGLTVAELTPHRCHGGGQEYFVRLLDADGQVWAEASHETADSIHGHIRSYRKREQA
ncbi:hypothetical protein JNW90_01280 [Micromonospora sp. STR1s_5]|nr:hypothetical protein [Micromonospora sp. STR1s_5]